MLSGGTPIPLDADMNDYIEIGNYYAGSNTVAESLSNAPFAYAFTLKVEYGQGTSYPRQIARNNLTGQIATRGYYLTGTNVWSDWVYFSDDATLLKQALRIATSQSGITPISNAYAQAYQYGIGIYFDQEFEYEGTNYTKWQFSFKTDGHIYVLGYSENNKWVYFGKYAPNSSS